HVCILRGPAGRFQRERAARRRGSPGFAPPRRDTLPPSPRPSSSPRGHSMPLRLVKDYLRRRRLARAGVRRRLAVPAFRAGARSAVWAGGPAGLAADGVGSSFGVGDNVAWDLAMIDTFGLTIHAFDPTPASVAWVGRQRLPAGFRFHPVGLAGHDGVARFRAPARPGSCNYVPCGVLPPLSPGGRRAGGEGASWRDTIEAPVRRLSSLMAKLGHGRID